MKNSERLYPVKEYTRYSASHIQKQFRDIYGKEIRRIDYGYKGYRYRRFTEYEMYDIETGKLDATKLSLSALGDYLVSKGDY